MKHFGKFICFVVHLPPFTQGDFLLSIPRSVSYHTWPTTSGRRSKASVVEIYYLSKVSGSFGGREKLRHSVCFVPSTFHYDYLGNKLQFQKWPDVVPWTFLIFIRTVRSPYLPPFVHPQSNSTSINCPINLLIEKMEDKSFVEGKQNSHPQ